ncbi:hypothetical protein MMC10_002059 [Thelotrema lepadinum]|nr:hypothetical protein [Thelotrema lepadinum]
MQAPFFAAKQQVRLHEWDDTKKCYADDPNKEYKHEVCQLELKAWGAYVIDLAAAQYGYFDPVYHPYKYMPGLQAVQVDKGPLAGYEPHWIEMMEACSEPDRSVNTVIVNGHLRNSKAIDEAMAVWEVQNGKSIAKLLRAEEQVFEKDCKALVAFISNSLQTFWQHNPARLDKALGREIPEAVLEKIRREQSGGSPGENAKKT